MTVTVEAPSSARAGSEILIRITLINDYPPDPQLAPDGWIWDYWFMVQENYKPTAVNKQIFTASGSLAPGLRKTYDVRAKQPDTVDLTWKIISQGSVLRYGPHTKRNEFSVAKTVKTSDKPTWRWVRKPANAWQPWDPAYNRCIVKVTNNFTFSTDVRVKVYSNNHYEVDQQILSLGAGQR